MLRQADLHRIDSESVITFGSIVTSFFKTNHSIPDCLGVVFDTPEGTVVHTGDFKFDMTPVNRQYPDIHRMADIGKKVSGFCCPRAPMLNGPGSLRLRGWSGSTLKRPFKKRTEESSSQPLPLMSTACSRSWMPLI